jgi:hypothetical protein
VREHAAFVRGLCVSVALLGAFACSPAEKPVAPPAGASSPAKSGAPLGPAVVSALGSALANTTATTSADAPPIIERPPAISFTEALDITFPAGVPAEAERCKSEGASAGSGAANSGAADERAADAARIRCLLRARFAGDDAARDMAIELYDKVGIVTGVGRDQKMDGGWRGEIHLVPELPVGKYKKHLAWVKAGFEDIDAFFAGLDARRAPGTKAAYRYRALSLRFLRSAGRTTPSAYAQDWEVSYNVSGSLHASAEAVRETLFHEVFHTNDARHGHWSQKALTATVDSILDKCGQNSGCLAPYAPGTTMVRGGTYYAFQKGNGVGEYAAELASRYFLEHHAILSGKKHGKAPFKCGPPENAKTWKALVDEFFGADLTGDCPSK